MALNLWDISLNPWDWALILVAIAGAVAAGAYFFSKTRIEPVGIVRANDFTDEKIRQAVIRAVKGVDVAAPDREKAEKLIEELARHAAGKEYANIYPGHRVEVTESWPDARCIITGNIAVIDIWVGHSIIGHGDGIRPMQVEVNRAPTLNLSTKRPIREAFDELHAPPPKTAKPPEKAAISTPSRVPKRATLNKG